MFFFFFPPASVKKKRGRSLLIITVDTPGSNCNPPAASSVCFVSPWVPDDWVLPHQSTGVSDKRSTLSALLWPHPSIWQLKKNLFLLFRKTNRLMPELKYTLETQLKHLSIMVSSSLSGAQGGKGLVFALQESPGRYPSLTNVFIWFLKLVNVLCIFFFCKVLLVPILDPTFHRCRASDMLLLGLVHLGSLRLSYVPGRFQPDHQRRRE